MAGSRRPRLKVIAAPADAFSAVMNRRSARGRVHQDAGALGSSSRQPRALFYVTASGLAFSGRSQGSCAAPECRSPTRQDYGLGSSTGQGLVCHSASPHR